MLLLSYKAAIIGLLRQNSVKGKISPMESPISIISLYHRDGKFYAPEVVLWKERGSYVDLEPKRTIAENDRRACGSFWKKTLI